MNSRQLYRKMLSLNESFLETIETLKTGIAEWNFILKKRTLYRQMVLSKEQQNTIADFWLKNYGRKISLRWHKYFQSINGVYDPKYFPEIIYNTKLVPKLNPLNICRVLGDKSLTELLYTGVNGIKCPETIVVNCSGYFYDNKRNIIKETDALEILNCAGKVVIKPNIGGSSGRGVAIFHLNHGIVEETGKSTYDLLENYRINYIIQKFISPNDQFAIFHNSSINTVRITTYILSNKIFHMPMIFRMGTNGNKIDNTHAGGIGIGVSDDGILKKTGYDLNLNKYYQHPNSGVKFDGFKLPFMSKIINAAHAAHKKTPHIGIVSWDFTIDETDDVVLIEANYIGQGIRFHQLLNERSAFGENTEQVLLMLKN